MKPHQERVITEKQQLDEKIAKLSAFLDQTEPVEPAEIGRLRRQLAAMEDYSEVLGERIENFKA